MTDFFLDRFWSKVDVRGDDECWVWTGATARRGYGAFAPRKGKLMVASRFSWEMHKAEQIPDGLWVLHHCDNPPCVNPKHLYLGTRQENMDDMVRRRRHWAHRGELITQGVKNGRAKLTDRDIVEIREIYALGNVSQPELGRRYGVVHASIGNIVRRDSWRHVA